VVVYFSTATNRRSRGASWSIIAPPFTAADQGVRIEVISSSYGYFPMLLFLCGIFRQRNVLWFMDEYVAALARFPKAKFHFVGHSNGTYLLASSLRRYKSSTFDRALLAGSVVPRKFPWDRYAETRIHALRNYVATRDIVVGIFPGIFELLGSKEIGTAGHNGFTDRFSQRHQVTYIKGGHAAAIAEDNFDFIIAFMLGEQAPDTAPALKSEARERWAVIVSKLCWAVCSVLALFLLAPLALLLISSSSVKMIFILSLIYLAMVMMLLLTA